MSTPTAMTVRQLKAILAQAPEEHLECEVIVELYDEDGNNTLAGLVLANLEFRCSDKPTLHLVGGDDWFTTEEGA